jgi:ferredoxin-NADP reductase
MSDVRLARCAAIERFERSSWLRFEVSDGRPLAFRGGQYVIVDTGLLLPDGKKRKRAYSILSADVDRTRFELGVFQLPGGLGCEWLTQLPLGAELRFSGPWGKLRAPETSGSGSVWVIATDSGASAALGLCRGREFAPHLARTRIHWWTTTPSYFLSPDWVRQRAPSCAELQLAPLSAIGSEARQTEVVTRTCELLRNDTPEQIYVLGDGQIARRLALALPDLGIDPARLQVESFFNHSERKSASIQAA